MSRRPPVEGSAPRIPIQTRVAPGLRDKINSASESSGRSIAQEIELRLERSFDMEEVTKNTIRESIRAAFDTFSEMIMGQEAALINQCGGDDLFLLWRMPAIAIQQIEQERGKSIRDDEETRRAAERAVLGVMTDVFRKLPPPYSEWKKSLEPIEPNGADISPGLAKLGALLRPSR